MIKCVDYANGEEIGYYDAMPTKEGQEHIHNYYTYVFKYGVNNVAFFTKKLFNDTIENNFSYHSPKDGQPEKYQLIRNKAKELAYLIEENVPSGREKSLAMTNIEQSVFWANAGIARS